jgi:hypothetical protein
MAYKIVLSIQLLRNMNAIISFKIKLILIITIIKEIDDGSDYV